MTRTETGDGVVREIRASTLADKVPPRISMPMSVVDRLFGLEGFGARCHCDRSGQEVTRGTLDY